MLADDSNGAEGLPSVRAVRELIIKHRSRLDRSEREFRLWQARWLTREREIEAQMQDIAEKIHNAEIEIETPAQPRPSLTIFPATDG